MILKELQEVITDKDLISLYTKTIQEMVNVVNSINKNDTIFEGVGLESNSMLSKLKNVVGGIRDTMSDPNRKKVPAPGTVDSGDVVNDMEVVIKQLAAAKRGLGITNKLQDYGQRAIHRSKIMSHLNRIRGNLRKIERKIANGESSDNY